MATGEPIVYKDFTGGVHIDEGEYLINDNQCSDARNVHSTEHGALTKRPGFSAFSDFQGVIDYPHSLFASTTSVNDALLAVGTYNGVNDAMITIDGAGATATIKTGLTWDKRWSFVQGPRIRNTDFFGDPEDSIGPVFGMNGVDPPIAWSGVLGEAPITWTAKIGLGGVGTVPTGTPYLIYHLDKLWASGDPEHPGRVWSTGLTADATPLPSPINWDTDYIDEVDPVDGQLITGLGKVGPYLLVFKDRKTYVLSDPAGRAYRPVSSSIGCCAHRSIVETTQGTIFLSEDMGVCITNGSQIDQISESIAPLLHQIANEAPLALKNAAATYHEDSYYLSVPYQSQKNSITLEYNVETGAWWIHTVAASDFALLDPSGTPRLYAGSPTTHKVARAFDPQVFTDWDGTTYSSYWEGPHWDWGNPHLRKRVKQIRLDGRGDWDIYAAETFSDSYQQLDSYPTDPWEGIAVPTEMFAGTGTFAPAVDDGVLFAGQLGVNQRRYPTPLEGVGRAWSIKLQDTTANKVPSDVYAVTAFVRTRTD